jgi:hypothetical protein
MVGPSVGTAKASPVNSAQCDRRVHIEIDPPAHNISGPKSRSGKFLSLINRM